MLVPETCLDRCNWDQEANSYSSFLPVFNIVITIGGGHKQQQQGNVDTTDHQDYIGSEGAGGRAGALSSTQTAAASNQKNPRIR